MWKYSELKKYQFIQKDKKEYLFKINRINGLFKREEGLIDEFKKYLGEDAIIDLEYVNDIPLLASGKRKLVVSDYQKETIS